MVSQKQNIDDSCVSMAITNSVIVYLPYLFFWLNTLCVNQKANIKKNHCLDIQVCIKFFVVVPLLIYRISLNIVPFFEKAQQVHKKRNLKLLVQLMSPDNTYKKNAVHNGLTTFVNSCPKREFNLRRKTTTNSIQT